MSRRKRDWSPWAMPAVRDLILDERLAEAAMVERLVESGLIPAEEAEYFGIKRWELSGAERLRHAEMFWIMPNMAAAAMDGVGVRPHV